MQQAILRSSDTSAGYHEALSVNIEEIANRIVEVSTTKSETGILKILVLGTTQML